MRAVSEEMLTQIVGSVFDTMMGMDVTPSLSSWQPDADWLIASVRFSGKWDGALLIECNRTQARRLVGVLLAIDPPNVNDEDVRDALGELANIIGGNVKFALGTALNLSLPSISEGNGEGFVTGQLERQNRLAFDCAVGTFWVTLQSTAPTAGLPFKAALA